ncbi:MAG TPA: CheR family methyltransferase [Verrucomicrobium sp.]|nr:CheR family methyltransferase [Verrucomicrobium sp.]
MERGILEAAVQLGLDDPSELVVSILDQSLPSEKLQVLVRGLTVGETYFFRDKAAFDYLEDVVLPRLLLERKAQNPRLRLWSAGCCTGEEAYSLAMLLQRLLTGGRHWHVTILATDINGEFLDRAQAGSYGDWSFRGTPPSMKGCYFTPAVGGRYELLASIREMVKFFPLNLVEDLYPALHSDTHAMDVIFCRNVLMYFTPLQRRNVVARLRRCLVEGGVLCVSPTEASQDLFSEFERRDYAGMTFYHNRLGGGEIHQWVDDAASVIPGTGGRRSQTPVLPPCEDDDEVGTLESCLRAAQSCFEEGRYSHVSEMLLMRARHQSLSPVALSMLSHALGNQGALDQAVVWCDRWVAEDKLNSAAHYLRAMLLEEQGRGRLAKDSLRQVLYLAPEFVMAHFALGYAAHREHDQKNGRRHFSNALKLLRRLPPDAVLPESGGLTAARLIHTVTSVFLPGEAKP